jgi:hypothetical protein
MGAASAFDLSTADFSRMTGKRGDVFLSDVVHEACVEVNEDGTEAAAATGMAIMPTAAPWWPEATPTARVPGGPSVPLPDSGYEDESNPVHGTDAGA